MATPNVLLSQRQKNYLDESPQSTSWSGWILQEASVCHLLPLLNYAMLSRAP